MMYDTLGRPIKTPEERFWPKVRKTETCWIWTAQVGKGGYGYFRINGRSGGAHRAAYLIFVGAIPEGYEVDHLCRVPLCVNPEHLEAVPPRINNLRSMSPAALNARKTHCPRGHDYTPVTDRQGKTKRLCRTCINKAQRDRAAARKRA